MTSPFPSGPTPAQDGTAASASPGLPQAKSGPDACEPVWPQPQPFTANLLKRLSRGLGSWFGLLNEWDFRIVIGSTNVLGLELVLVNRPALVRQVMVEESAAFPKHPYTQWILEPLIGQAIFAVNGAEWQRQRRLVDQALQTAQLRRVFPLMQDAVQAMLERIGAQQTAQNHDHLQGQLPVLGSNAINQANRNEFSFDAQEAMTLVTADVIVRTILSKSLDPNEAKEIFAAFARYQRRAGLAMVLRFLRMPKRWLQQLLKADASPIRGWIATAIAERQQSRVRAEGGSAPAERHQDLLDALEWAEDRAAVNTMGTPDPTGDIDQAAQAAAANPAGKTAHSGNGCDPGSRFSQAELLDQICFLFLAGHETSASALAMACYLLARYPEAQAQFAAEVRELRSQSNASSSVPAPCRPLGYDDLRQLPYGTALIQETLRLYPPVSFFIRESQTPQKLGESRCPMGALLAISPWVIQRHEHHWSDPNCFRPERFLADQASDADKQWARDAYLPFGLGPRKCPGAAFALQEALLVLAELISRYELLPEAGQEPQLVGNLTLRSRNGVHLRLRRRHGPGLET